MKRILCVLFILSCATITVAQEKEVTKIKTTTKTVSDDRVDLLGGETFNVIDATPLKANTIDLRLTGKWITANAPADKGHSHDDSVVTPTIVWGAFENFELSLSVPTWVGDGGDMPGQPDGNYDTYVGALWRFMGQQDYWPAMALGATIRTPTGDHSNGLDAELRLSMTNEYDNGLRSHLNFFASTVNTDNIQNARHFQYGAVVGMDGPLCAEGAVRWVLDYMWRISPEYGGDHLNMIEGGWQWQIAEAHKLGMSIQAALDHAEDNAPNMGAGLTYSYTIAY